MSKRRHPIPDAWIPKPAELCPLCGREIPADQRDEHHLVPRLKGGKETTALHRICHRQIHALFSEAELARSYATVEALLEHPEVQKFVAWVSTKPPGFADSARRSNRLSQHYRDARRDR